MTTPYDQLLEATRKARLAQEAQQESSKAIAAEIAAQRQAAAAQQQPSTGQPGVG